MCVTSVPTATCDGDRDPELARPLQSHAERARCAGAAAAQRARRPPARGRGRGATPAAMASLSNRAPSPPPCRSGPRPSALVHVLRRRARRARSRSRESGPAPFVASADTYPRLHQVHRATGARPVLITCAPNPQTIAAGPSASRAGASPRRPRVKSAARERRPAATRSAFHSRSTPLPRPGERLVARHRSAGRERVRPDVGRVERIGTARFVSRLSRCPTSGRTGRGRSTGETPARP